MVTTVPYHKVEMVEVIRGQACPMALTKYVVVKCILYLFSLFSSGYLYTTIANGLEPKHSCEKCYIPKEYNCCIMCTFPY